MTGRLLARGLADELRDQHFLLIDGIDGRTHFVDAGAADAVEPLPPGAIVRVVPHPHGLRDSDRTIVAVAAANEGQYSPEFHVRHAPGASPAFVEAHVRRLEAMRRPLRLERGSEGIWRIGEDHLARVEAYEARAARQRPVAVEVLSPLPLEQLPGHDGATWLDRELLASEPASARDAGFGRDVRSALALRRAWLLREGLAEDLHGQGVVRADTLAVLRRRELDRVAAQLGRETGKDFLEAGEGTRVEGTVRRRLDLACGRFAVIESAHEFSLVPWRPVLARALGMPVSGIVREAGTSWTIGRGRAIEI